MERPNSPLGPNILKIDDDGLPNNGPIKIKRLSSPPTIPDFRLLCSAIDNSRSIYHFQHLTLLDDD
jgi:hypothetical protein